MRLKNLVYTVYHTKQYRELAALRSTVILTYVDYVFRAGEFEGHGVDLKSDFGQRVEFTAVEHVLTRK